MNSFGFSERAKRRRRNKTLGKLGIMAGLAGASLGTGLGISYLARNNADRDSGKAKIEEKMPEERKLLPWEGVGRQDGIKESRENGIVIREFPGGQKDFYENDRLTKRTFPDGNFVIYYEDGTQVYYDKDANIINAMDAQRKPLTKEEMEVFFPAGSKEIPKEGWGRSPFLTKAEDDVIKKIKEDINKKIEEQK